MPAYRSLSSRLPAALALSLSLHVALLVLPAWWVRPAPLAKPPLQAMLVTPAALELPQKAADSLLKDTLAKEEENRARALERKEARDGARSAARREKSGPEAARRKLAQHVYYPEEAIRRGLEGEVRLLVLLDETGRVVSAEVAASSGHAILDEAARSAALSMGRLPDTDTRQFILAVPFRLR